MASKLSIIARYIPACIFFIFCSCSDNGSVSDRKEYAEADADEFVSAVDTMAIHKLPFKSDIVSNGRIRALEYADMFFRTPELIEDVLVKNGQKVKKGQVLARLDLFKLNAEKTRQADAIAKAELELQDVLIGQGYNPDDVASVPADVMRLARTRSGLDQAEASYNTAVRDIENATLRAPFDGVVANVNGARHTLASTGDPFCRIINNSRMAVEFPILESELPHIANGQTVDVLPFGNSERYTGLVSEINPLVDESGHVTVRAVMSDASGLIDGLNVRVRCSHSLGERIVVPKSAVVLRTGRQVIFTYHDGKALWKYVSTGLENLDSYEITEGLNEGDIVIYSGNENLAHESPVSISPAKR